jgi:hypothetical protein
MNNVNAYIGQIQTKTFGYKYYKFLKFCQHFEGKNKFQENSTHVN